MTPVDVFKWTLTLGFLFAALWLAAASLVVAFRLLHGWSERELTYRINQRRLHRKIIKLEPYPALYATILEDLKSELRERQVAFQNGDAYPAKPKPEPALIPVYVPPNHKYTSGGLVTRGAGGLVTGQDFE